MLPFAIPHSSFPTRSQQPDGQQIGLHGQSGVRGGYGKGTVTPSVACHVELRLLPVSDSSKALPPTSKPRPTDSLKPKVDEFLLALNEAARTLQDTDTSQKEEREIGAQYAPGDSGGTVLRDNRQIPRRLMMLAACPKARFRCRLQARRRGPWRQKLLLCRRDGTTPA